MFSHRARCLSKGIFDGIANLRKHSCCHCVEMLGEKSLDEYYDLFQNWNKLIKLDILYNREFVDVLTIASSTRMHLTPQKYDYLMLDVRNVQWVQVH